VDAAWENISDKIGLMNIARKLKYKKQPLP
jgi:hypothetical protein